MNKLKLREFIELFFSLLFSWLYIPHLFCYLLIDRKKLDADVDRYKEKFCCNFPRFLCLLIKLHWNPYFRTIFYHRIGPLFAMLISWYRKGAPTFLIPPSLKIGGGLYAPHCYGTVLNAKSIGDNFTVLQLTTLGKKSGHRPVIGNNVKMGANVSIIGDITIGDFTIVGAGSVVTKNTPPHSVVAGVPARVLKIKE